MSLLENAKSLGINGHLSSIECDKLSELSKDKICLEIGSFRGLSAFCIASSAISLICLDTFDPIVEVPTQFIPLQDF